MKNRILSVRARILSSQRARFIIVSTILAFLSFSFIILALGVIEFTKNSFFIVTWTLLLGFVEWKIFEWISPFCEEYFGVKTKMHWKDIVGVRIFAITSNIFFKNFIPLLYDDNPIIQMVIIKLCVNFSNYALISLFTGQKFDIKKLTFKTIVVSGLAILVGFIYKPAETWFVRLFFEDYTPKH